MCGVLSTECSVLSSDCWVLSAQAECWALSASWVTTRYSCYQIFSPQVVCQERKPQIDHLFLSVLHILCQEIHCSWCWKWKVFGVCCDLLMVWWHEISLFQNMLPINAFIKVAVLFFQVWSQNLAQIQSFQNIGVWNWASISMLLWLTLSLISLLLWIQCHK